MSKYRILKKLYSEEYKIQKRVLFFWTDITEFMGSEEGGFIEKLFHSFDDAEKEMNKLIAEETDTRKNVWGVIHYSE